MYKIKDDQHVTNGQDIYFDKDQDDEDEDDMIYENRNVDIATPDTVTSVITPTKTPQFNREDVKAAMEMLEEGSSSEDDKLYDNYHGSHTTGDC